MWETDLKRFGTLVLAARETRKLSHKELAAALNQSENWVRSLEEGGITPTEQCIDQLVTTLRVPATYLKPVQQ